MRNRGTQTPPLLSVIRGKLEGSRGKQINCLSVPCVYWKWDFVGKERCGALENWFWKWRCAANRFCKTWATSFNVLRTPLNIHTLSMLSLKEEQRLRVLFLIECPRLQKKQTKKKHIKQGLRPDPNLTAKCVEIWGVSKIRIKHVF